MNEKNLQPRLLYLAKISFKYEGEIKMESQINSLETRIEKMQERFNKDLEEIKKSQSIINNAINDIKLSGGEPIVE